MAAIRGRTHGAFILRRHKKTAHLAAFLSFNLARRPSLRLSARTASALAQEVRALLVARKQLRAKMRDVEMSLRGNLRGFSLKIGEISKGRDQQRAMRGAHCVGWLILR
jgi:hypothetical protein